jgi:hypothetical protein
MSLKRMTRMISFRISEHDFALLKNKSEALGARSVSDYARVALCSSARPMDVQVENDLHHLSVGVQQLSVELRRLFDLLDVTQGPRPVASNGNGAARND